MFTVASYRDDDIVNIQIGRNLAPVCVVYRVKYIIYTLVDAMSHLLKAGSMRHLLSTKRSARDRQDQEKLSRSQI
jgi:hypothetical protein